MTAKYKEIIKNKESELNSKFDKEFQQLKSQLEAQSLSGVSTLEGQGQDSQHQGATSKSPDVVVLDSPSVACNNAKYGIKYPEPGTYHGLSTEDPSQWLMDLGACHSFEGMMIRFLVYTLGGALVVSQRTGIKDKAKMYKIRSLF